MLGIDLTNISRFENVSESFINRILHKEEIKEYHESNDKKMYLASRWAIKEALYKANNQFKEFSLIRIQKKDRTYSYPGYIISTTKEDNYYIAVVQKEKNDS